MSPQADSGDPVYSMTSNSLVTDQEQEDIDRIDYENCSREQFSVIIDEWRDIPSLKGIIANQKKLLIKSTKQQCISFIIYI